MSSVHKTSGPQVHRSTLLHINECLQSTSPHVFTSTGPQVHRSTLLHINECLQSTSPRVHRSTLLHINECLQSTSPQVHRSTGPQVHTTSYKLMFPVYQFSGPQVHIGSISAALSCLVYPPFPEQRLVIEPKVHTTSYKSISPVHRSSGLQVHHFGSRIKHSYLHTYGELVCKEFSRFFFPVATIGDYMLAKIVGSSFSAGERSEWIMEVNIFAVLRS